MKGLYFQVLFSFVFLWSSCKTKTSIESPETTSVSMPDTFEVAAEEFADLQVLRYQIPGWEQLNLKEKQLCYYLYEAVLSGRDIIYDQKSKYGIVLRKTIENIYSSFKGDKTTNEWKEFEVYCGRFWFSNGNYHHYGNEKFAPACSWNYFKSIAFASDTMGYPKEFEESLENFLKRIHPWIYNLKLHPKCVDLSPGIDNILASSNNFYEGVSQKEVENFYHQKPNSPSAPSWGLNSKLCKEKGKIVEKPWYTEGMYGPAIKQMVYWLEKASSVAENDKQKQAFDLLIKYFRSGKLEDFDAYNIAWVNDTESKIDLVLGFIEVYLDAIGKKGSFEGILSIRDEESTKRIKAIAEQAQWFEDNSPIDPMHKKKDVKGISAKAITVVAQSGDAAPVSSIGINLPNADWIRKDHGSKSVSLSNITRSYNAMNSRKGSLDEFVANEEIKQRIKKYGALSSDLHTDMHECIGHASGQINPNVETTDKTLKNYASCLEEARADLVALYFVLDQKLIEIGVMPDLEVGKAEYDQYILNGLMTQLTRIKPGDQIEEAHMRNRQLVSKWAYEKGKPQNTIEFFKNNNKTYVRINDYNQLRLLFGQLLKEIQRIKSEGDFESGKDLVENYGVKFDTSMHREILDRYKELNLKPYKGFIQAKLIAVKKGDSIIDVKVEYPKSFYQQMLEYGKYYSFLSIKN
ncbi:MAG: dihydrofolate reductase [Saprospiraceae bacterium]|nr:dihydrofolate reductase [Saprospiraceae bacterium]